MPRYAAYVVTIGTEPGVYDDWGEAGECVLGVPGSLYKGYSTRYDAEEAFRRAQARGTVKVVHMHGERRRRAASSPSPAPPPQEQVSSRSDRPPAARSIAQTSAHESRQVVDMIPTASARSHMTQSSRREQGGTERATPTLSSPTTGITHYEPNTPPVRARQPRPSPSPARPNAPQTPIRSPALPILPQRGSRTRPVSVSSDSDRGTSSSPDTEVTTYEYETHPHPSSPASPLSSRARAPQTRAPSELSSPVSGVTYEPDFLPFRCGAGSASSAASTPSPVRRRATYVDVHTQTPTRARPNPVRASASLGSVPHTSRGERCECDEPRLICECCGRPVILRVPRSPAQSTNAHRDRSPHAQDTAPPSPTRPFMRSSRVLSRSQSEQNALSPLSALGLLSLREPPHTSVVVHDAASDPRSPIRRGSRVPMSAAAAFGRPSPSMPSIGESLIGLRR